MPTLHQSTTFYANRKWLICIDKDSVKINEENKDWKVKEDFWERIYDEIIFFGHNTNINVIEKIHNLIFSHEKS